MNTKESALTLILCLMTLVMAVAQPSSLLWKISGNGLSQPSYLFGTVHTACPEDLIISPQVQSALLATDNLVLELDMDEPNFAAEMQQQAVNDGMMNVQDILTSEEAEVLNAFFAEHFGVGLDRLGILKPFTLLSMVFIASMACEQPASYEETLMARVHAEGKPVFGLERIKDQIAVFDRVELREQMDWVMKYASDSEVFAAEIDQLNQAYQSGNIEALLGLMVNYPEYLQIQDALLFDRNEKWIPEIESHIQKEPSFIAVGSAHLASDRGVISLLAELGYTVTPVLQTNKI